MSFILGKKLGMSQIFSDDGAVIPVTVVGIDENVVLQIKTKDKDGYEGVQLGVGIRKEKNIAKPQKGHFKNLGNFAKVREFRANGSELKPGDKLDASVFNPGDKVRVSGLTKGKGFQGVVKRHGFRGMPFSHGHHSVLRHAGSIGQRFPQHTLKGMRMPGRMGADKFTVRGLTVVGVDKENGIIALKGAVPGNRGGLVKIEKI
jgi:large subunit ribosomal protein L3